MMTLVPVSSSWSIALGEVSRVGKRIALRGVPMGSMTCRRCRAPYQGRTNSKFCSRPCSRPERGSEAHVRDIKYGTDRYARLRAAGVCVRCGASTGGLAARCPGCADRMRGERPSVDVLR